MENNHKIPIKNIYLILCYAWNILSVHSEKLCGTVKFENIYNLLARILILSVKQIKRRGFYTEYIEMNENLPYLRGKVNISDSIKQQTSLKKQLNCCYDQLSPDTVFNQIIKAGINLFLLYKPLDKTLHQELIKLSMMFRGISDKTPNHSMFAQLKYDRNNTYYRLAVNVCQLLYEGLISTESNGTIVFSDFIRDQKMASLYEKFVLNFYKLHLDSKVFKTYAPKIPWNLNWKSVKGSRFLPEMRTDIVIENRAAGFQLIIDTKFYPEIFTQHNYGIKKTLKSENLYQIYTYVGNSPYSGSVKGMLLYPVVDANYDMNFPFADGTSILIKTLDLGADWFLIEKRLLEFVNVFLVS